jgi:hypothetical protein
MGLNRVYKHSPCGLGTSGSILKADECGVISLEGFTIKPNQRPVALQAEESYTGIGDASARRNHEKEHRPVG